MFRVVESWQGQKVDATFKLTELLGGWDINSASSAVYITLKELSSPSEMAPIFSIYSVRKLIGVEMETVELLYRKNY
jgi:hypothetical protein